MKFALKLLLFSALSSIFRVVQSVSPQEEVDACRGACSDFIPKLERFYEPDVPRQELTDIIELSWTTCQFKCYRCALNGGIQIMKELRLLFYHNRPYVRTPPYSFVYINPFQEKLNQVVNRCYNQWNDANLAGDAASSFSD